MSVFLGIPSDSRSASQVFSSIGENYRKADRMEDLKIRARVCVDASYTFLSYLMLLPWYLSSAASGHPQILGVDIQFALSSVAPFLDFEVGIALACTSAILSSVVDHYHLISKSVGQNSKANYGYVGRVQLTQLKKLVQSVGQEKIRFSSGVQGQGMSPNAVLSALAMSRIIGIYVTTQMRRSYSNETMKTDTDSGFIRTKISVAADGEDYIETHDDKWVVNQETFERLGLTATTNYEVIRYEPVSTNISTEATPSQCAERTGHPIIFTPFSLPGDGEYFADRLYRYFSAFFSFDYEKARISCQTIADSVPLISRSVEGQMILFLMYSVFLSIESGSRLQIIKDEARVLGVILITLQPLMIGRNLVAPVLGKDMRQTLSTWTTLDQALDVVAKSLSERSMVDDSPKRTITGYNINTFKDLMLELTKRRQATSLPSSVLQALRAISYDNFVPLSCTTENVAKCFLNCAGLSVPSNCWINETLLTRNPVIAANLSVFGPSSISLLNPGGKKIDLYIDKTEDPLAGKKKEIVVQTIVPGKKGKRRVDEKKETVAAWDRLCLSRVPVLKAIEDYRTVQKLHTIHQLSTYDTKILGNVDVHPISGGDNELLAAIRFLGGTKAFFDAQAPVKQKFVPLEPVGEEMSDDEETGGLAF
jgi:hypothetical protein